jgi:hypothetical protein
MFSVLLRSCSCSVLAHVLDPSVPFVWVQRHWPNPRVEWRVARVPLSRDGQPRDVEVRSLEYDLQLPTARFLELLPEFEDKGMNLYQMVRRVPDTLTLYRVADHAIDGVLIQVGLHLRFSLPHAGETAELASPHRDVLERALQSPAVRELAYEVT